LGLLGASVALAKADRKATEARINVGVCIFDSYRCWVYACKCFTWDMVVKIRVESNVSELWESASTPARWESIQLTVRAD